MIWQKAKWVLLFNLIFGLVLFVYFNPSRLSYCGHFEGAPEIGLGLYPDQYMERFDFRYEFRLERFNHRVDTPTNDAVLRGRELYKDIAAYGISARKDGFYLRVIDWSDQEQVYWLRFHAGSTENRTTFELVEPTGPIEVERWIEVDQLSCRSGIFMYAPIFVAVLVVIFNVGFLIWLAAKMPDRPWRD